MYFFIAFSIYLSLADVGIDSKTLSALGHAWSVAPLLLETVPHGRDVVCMVVEDAPHWLRASWQWNTLNLIYYS